MCALSRVGEGTEGGREGERERRRKIVSFKLTLILELILHDVRGSFMEVRVGVWF